MHKHQRNATRQPTGARMQLLLVTEQIHSSLSARHKDPRLSRMKLAVVHARLGILEASQDLNRDNERVGHEVLQACPQQVGKRAGTSPAGQQGAKRHLPQQAG